MPNGVGTQFASSEKSNPLLHIQKENPSTINNRIANWRFNTPQGFGRQFASIERDHQLSNNNHTVTPVYHKLNDRLEIRRFGNTNMTGGLSKLNKVMHKKKSAHQTKSKSKNKNKIKKTC